MTFFAPRYLFGLILIAVPILIHLWLRRRMKKVAFSSLEFLKKTEARRLGWLRLREILVLACRCLFTGLLFLSLSRPQLGNNAPAGNRRASVYLILDDTYSMGYGDNFGRAKRIADRLIDAYAPNAEFFVTGLAAAGPVGDFFWMSRRSAHERLKKIELGYRTGVVKTLLEKYPAIAPRFPLEYIYIGDGQEANFRDYDAGQIKGRKMYWIRVRAGQNAGLTGVAAKDPARLTPENYAVTVRLDNYSPRAWAGKIEVKAGGFFHQADCRIPAGLEHDEELVFPGAVRRGEAIWLGDSLEADNHFYFSIFRPSLLRILIAGPGGFLALTLNPSRELRTLFTVQSVVRIGTADLRNYDAVILDGLADLTEGEVKRLGNFLAQKNKAVLCFLGDQAGENLKNFLAPAASVGDPITPRGYATLGWVDYEHYAFLPFKGTAALKEIKFYKFWNLIRHGRSVASLDPGHDLIVIRDNLAVIGTRFDAAGSDIVYQAAFLPLLHRLVYSLFMSAAEKSTYLVGQKSDVVQTLRGPRGLAVGPGDEFPEPGFYTAEEDSIAVNVLPEEGNLKVIGENALKSLGIREFDPDRSRGLGDLSWLSLILALIMVLAEQILLLV
jgi:hypothetical protein